MIDLDKDLTIFGNNQNSDYFNEINSYSRVQIIENVDISVDEISSYRLGLYSSKSESGPLVLLEYILAEIPFLAYQVGGMADAIAEFFPEYFINNFEKAEWKLRILKLLEVPFDVELHRQKVNEMMMKYFSEENYKNELFKIYNGLMKC
jgi:glycosyltransferase involved in cell wall biosynthesis